MLVELSVVETLAVSNPADRRLFAAGCAERTGQVFGLVRSAEDDRADDIVTYVEALNALWDEEASPEALSAAHARVMQFPELQDSDELVDVGDTYAFYSVLTLMYALKGAASGEAQDCVKCAHAALTAMGQLDQNVPAPRFMDQERQRQRETLSLVTVSLAATRAADAAIGRERVDAVNARMRP